MRTFVLISSMKSNNNSNGSNTLKNWVIEVSNDKQKWEEIDRHEAPYS